MFEHMSTASSTPIQGQPASERACYILPPSIHACISLTHCTLSAARELQQAANVPFLLSNVQRRSLALGLKTP